MAKWTLLKLTATVETKEKGTLAFDFDMDELRLCHLEGGGDGNLDVVTMKDLIDMIGAKVIAEVEK